MRTKLWLTGLVAACAGAGLLIAAPAQAADEWTAVSKIVCNDHSRSVDSWVRGDDARAEFTICWNDSLNDVQLYAGVSDGNGNDGYHAEARIRYQVWTGSAWSGWHYRTPAAAYGPDDGEKSGLYRASQKTRNVQAAACLYNGATLIDCDDRGWR